MPDVKPYRLAAHEKVVIKMDDRITVRDVLRELAHNNVDIDSVISYKQHVTIIVDGKEHILPSEEIDAADIQVCADGDNTRIVLE